MITQNTKYRHGMAVTITKYLVPQHGKKRLVDRIYSFTCLDHRNERRILEQRMLRSYMHSRKNAIYHIDREFFHKLYPGIIYKTRQQFYISRPIPKPTRCVRGYA